MTLRSRLVAGLAALLLVGLTAFGIVTYEFYSRSQYQQLDAQLREVIPPGTLQLFDSAGLSGAGVGNVFSDTNRLGAGPAGAGPQPVALIGTYAELRDSSGRSVPNGRIQSAASADQPDLTGPLPLSKHYATVGAAKGTGSWRVTTDTITDRPGYTVVVAIPTRNVESSLQRLIFVESIAGLALLIALAGGAWIILRRGLRPLENMAVTARSINAGDMSHRVELADGRGEIGQLGRALNTMLSEMEESFARRDATEAKLRRFLSDVSHELRTPLTSIQGFAELFRLGTSNDHIDQSVLMRRIEQESARMKRLVEDLLLLARLDETRPLLSESVDLTVLAADACSDAAAIDPSRRISLHSTQPVVVTGDRDHLRQAIANLMSNAVKHTPPGTQIEVGTEVNDDLAVVTVRDHGPGLDPDALSHVFDRFWQADTARVGTGAGLGLSIVAAIAQEHRGQATATNHAEGGAQFALALPIGAWPHVQ